MVVLKGILLVLLALSAITVLLSLAAGILLESADSVASIKEKADLKEENRRLKEELERMRRMP